MAKMTKGQIDELIEKVKLLIIKAYSDYAIVKTVMAQYNLGERMSQKHVARAHEELNNDAKKTVEQERKQSIRRIKYLIQKAMEAGQYKTALQGQAQLDKLTGASHQEVVKHHIELSTPAGDNGKSANGFLAMIVNAREKTAALEEEMIERYRNERTSGS